MAVTNVGQRIAILDCGGEEHPRVNPRFLPKLWPIFLVLTFVACSKKQAPSPALTAGVVPAPSKAVSAVPVGDPSDSLVRFNGEVSRGARFRAPIGSNMYFTLEPYAGNDSGWSIRLTPGTDPKSQSIDCIGAVAEPLHGDKNLEIEPPANLATQKSIDWKPREFEFVPDAANCSIAWDLMNAVYYPSKLTDEQRTEAGEKLAKIPVGHGRFTIIQSILQPPKVANETGSIQWLKFEVELNFRVSEAAPPQLASPATVRQPASASAASIGIRAVDLAKFLNEHYGEVNPQFADLDTECGEGQKPIQSLAPFLYGDLDGDVQEEAAFMAFTCMSGTGGVDFFGVLKLLPGGTIVALPIQDAPKRFKGRDPYQGLRGHLRLEISGGRLLEAFPVYNGNEPNCCSEGGERKFVYRWDGHQFVFDDIIDVPPPPEEKKSGS